MRANSCHLIIELSHHVIYLTISLGEPFNGFCYKLVAAVMMQNKDCQ